MEIVLLWCFVLAWMAKRGAEDLVHAVKGTTNPRYELKKQRAKAAGQPARSQPRYGGREWFADLYSDALAAHTEKRRRSAAVKGQPLDDLAEAVREPREARAPVFPARPVGDIGEEDWCEKHGMPRMRQGVWEHGPRSRFCPCGPRVEFQPPETPEDEGLDVRIAAAKKRMEEESMSEREPTADEVLHGLMGPGGLFTGVNAPMCHRCGGVQRLVDGRIVCACTPAPTVGDDSPTARIYQFPNINQLTKEIDMSNSEVTGLSTATAYAEEAAAAHASFNAEGYSGALARLGFGESVLALEAEAREASSTATAKWQALAEAMKGFQGGREFYTSNPDAPDKVALVNE